MPDQHDTRALDRLQHLDRNFADDTTPEGSPGLEMAVSIVLPGAPALRRAPVLGSALLLVGVVAPIALAVWAYSRRDDLIGLALDQRFLMIVIGIGLAVVIVRLIAITEIVSTYRRVPGIGGVTAAATAVVILMALPVLWASFRANEARSAVGDVFTGGSKAPLFEPDVETSGVDPDDVTNILLLGGDAGPGRWGLRTDTIILVTVHEASGRTALLSIPRNLTRVEFPPGSPLADDFPNGFDDLANAVFPYVSTSEALMSAYGRDGLQGEAVALTEAIGYSLDVEIDDYALVNMQGFLEVIDAVGGVTLELNQSVPLPPSIPGGKTPIPESVGPGVIDMDGTLALAYARSRSADSDYARMGRQRQLLAALGSQVSTGDALRGFGEVTGVLDDSMRTSLSSSEFSNLLDRLGDNEAIRESIGLVPPLITPGDPDYGQIRTIVDAIQLSVVSGEPSGYAG